MSDYRENLTAPEVGVVFKELGLDIHLSPDELFSLYRGRKWTLMRHKEYPVILNVLPDTSLPEDSFWEEWYLHNGMVFHHILTLTDPGHYDEIFMAPPSDDIHPPETFGRKWYVQNNLDMKPFLCDRG